MAKKVPDETWRVYFKARDSGMDITTAAQRAGIGKSTAYRLENDPNYNSTGRAVKAEWRKTSAPPIRDTDHLPADAQRALDDFAYFRLRYFGRKSTLWQVAAANQVRALLESPKREYAVINAPPGSGKALALDTPIPTPTGWSTIKELEAGDLVFGANGKPTRVVAKSEVFYGHDCYEVSADDGPSVIADAEHLWPVRLHGHGQYGTWKSKDDYLGKTGPKPSPDGRHNHTTRKLAEPRSKRPQLQIAAPLDLPDADLPIDPYVLGVWLGDGSKRSPVISAADEDATYTRAEIEKAGYTTTECTQPQAFHVGSRTGQRWKRDGLASDLRSCGLLENKHIPEAYFRASAAQRLALLQGLIDTDGYVGPTGHIEFCNTNKNLARGVQQLVHSLGAKASLREGRATLNGKDCGTKYRVAFYLADAARLPRKRALCRNGERTPSRYLTVTPVESVPTQCIQVEAPDGLYLAGEGMLVTHNSVLFTHDIPCWLIARKRSIRIMICSASEARARLYVEQILATLERNEPAPLEEEQEIRGAVKAAACMQADFGRFKPENARRWRAGAFKVAQSGDMVGTTKESTVVAVGLDTRFLGDRVDLLIADDVVTNETTSTPEMREKVLRKWRNEVEKRIEKRGVLILQGQRIAAEDLYRTCIDLKAWADPTDPYADPDARKYLHIIFRAHYEDHCAGHHAETDPAFDPFDPDRGGCLLDPVGLPWPYLMQERADDERTYRTVFQQEDMDPDSVLVNPLWVEGGVDDETGETFPGCWDRDRVIGLNPELASATKPPLSVITVDSSPTKYWAILRWVYDHDTQRRFLVDIHRARMQVTHALAYNTDTHSYSGVLEDMVREAAEQRPSYPVTHLIFETNDAEKFFTDAQLFKDWCALRKVTLIEHKTHRNKIDPQYGVEALLPPVYKYGRVRLPGHSGSGSRKRAQQLVTEVTRYPECSTDDALMSQWFLENRLPTLASVVTSSFRRAHMPLLPSRSHLRRVS